MRYASLLLFVACHSPSGEHEQEAFLSLAGNQVHYKVVGKGQAIILAHGGYLNATLKSILN